MVYRWLGHTNIAGSYGVRCRAGIVKVGDRVLEINGCNMRNCSQFDALAILRGASEMVTMVIEYEVELQSNLMHRVYTEY